MNYYKTLNRSIGGIDSLVKFIEEKYFNNSKKLYFNIDIFGDDFMYNIHESNSMIGVVSISLKFSEPEYINVDSHTYLLEKQKKMIMTYLKYLNRKNTIDELL